MSAEAIRRVLQELETLPDSDQELVLCFLATLRDGRISIAGASSRQQRSDSIEEKDGLLVFTGQVHDLGSDWLRIVRDERDEYLAHWTPGKMAAE